MSKEIIKGEKYGLNKNESQKVSQAFEEKVKERILLSEVYRTIIKKDITPEVAQEAREIRLKAVKIKSGIASIHKTQKEYALAFGKYCDAWKRKETEPVQQIIDNLLEIEKHEERKEEERLNKLQAYRVNQILKYFPEANERDLSSMDSDVWEAFFQNKVNQYNKQLEAQRKDEEERRAKEEEERKENERIRKENEKLKKEREEREAKEAKERKEREKIELIAKQEREKREKLEAEIAEKKALEEKEKEENLKRSDSQKVSALIEDLNNLKTKYQFKSKNYVKKYKGLAELLDKSIKYINQ